MLGKWGDRGRAFSSFLKHVKMERKTYYKECSYHKLLDPKSTQVNIKATSNFRGIWMIYCRELSTAHAV